MWCLFTELQSIVLFQLSPEKSGCFRWAWEDPIDGILYCKNKYLGFPDSSVGKESACNAGDPGSIPGSGRPGGEGIGYSLQYSWASLVAQLVKNPPEMQDTWFQYLGWEDPLEKG